MQLSNTYSLSEFKLAKCLIEQSKKDRHTEVFQRTIKDFINNTKSGIVEDEDGNEHKVCLSLVIARSEPLKKMYRYDGYFKFPKFLIDEFHLADKIFSPNENLDLLIESDIFNFKIHKIDYSKITIENLFEYVRKTNCNIINTPIMKEIKYGLLVWCKLYELVGMWAIMAAGANKNITEIYNICQEKIEDKELNFNNFINWNDIYMDFLKDCFDNGINNFYKYNNGSVFSRKFERLVNDFAKNDIKIFK